MKAWFGLFNSPPRKGQECQFAMAMHRRLARQICTLSSNRHFKPPILNLSWLLFRVTPITEYCSASLFHWLSDGRLRSRPEVFFTDPLHIYIMIGQLISDFTSLLIVVLVPHRIESLTWIILEEQSKFFYPCGKSIRPGFYKHVEETYLTERKLLHPNRNASHRPFERC